MLRLTKKSHIRAIGYLGIAVTVLSIVFKALNCAEIPLQQRADMGIILGLIVGFSLMNSAALLELRNKIDALGKKR